jgi:hypothetical protein
MAEYRSPGSEPKEGEAHPQPSLQNLCPSVFICGSRLHGYSLTDDVCQATLPVSLKANPA